MVCKKLTPLVIIHFCMIVISQCISSKNHLLTPGVDTQAIYRLLWLLNTSQWARRKLYSGLGNATPQLAHFWWLGLLVYSHWGQVIGWSPRMVDLSINEPIDILPSQFGYTKFCNIDHKKGDSVSDSRTPSDTFPASFSSGNLMSFSPWTHWEISHKGGKLFLVIY